VGPLEGGKSYHLAFLTEDTLPPGTPPTRARVEARATLQQAEELHRVLGELGERLRE
jgi:hypothetical protein